MKHMGCYLLIVGGILTGTWTTGILANHPKTLPPCEPGYKWVEVTEYREVCRDVCKIVPDVKKTTKWVYSTIDDPFCIHKSGHHGHCGEGCPSCQGPYCRKQLVKKQVTCEEPITKCVVEKVVERVPCTTWQKVPCGSEGQIIPSVEPPPAKR